MELKDWLKSINKTKENLIDQDPLLEKEYAPYVINKCLSSQVDSILYSNEMNKYHFLDKKLQYDFYLNSLRIRNRFSPWIRNEDIENMEYIKSYYGYSNEKAKEAIKILTKQQIDFIKSKCYIGGKT